MTKFTKRCGTAHNTLRNKTRRETLDSDVGEELNITKERGNKRKSTRQSNANTQWRH